MNVNKLLVFSLVLSMSYQVGAQTGLSDELRDDLIGEYQEQPLSDEVNGELVEVSDVPIASPQQQVRFQPQQQPTTYVEANPITDSKAERIRKLRQKAEINTEEKIVEKLEVSRLKDEKRRAQKLFGNRLDHEEHQAVHPQPHPHPQQQVVKVVPVEDKTSKQDREDLRTEIIDAVREEINVSKEQELIDTAETKTTEDVYFATASFGFAEYSGISVPSDNSFGFGFGMVTAEGAFFEGGYSYSKFDLPDYRLRELEQHNFSTSLGFMFFNEARIRPNIGVLGSYTLRKYSGRNYGYGYSYNNNDKDDSNSFDLGFTGGVDFEVTDNFLIGVNMKYYVNVYSQEDTCYDYNCSYNNSHIKDSIESSDYYVFGVLSRFRF